MESLRELFRIGYGLSSSHTRNAFGASRAMNCADYALFTDGNHLMPFDEFISVMCETALGGLAAAYQRRMIGTKASGYV